ncbi:unnamed protein product [Protopolystoma xenopodis]|uniref:Uncharacterized protein n=1 Tax=Protopolystoma xenopodis TaxID=117903 RepID=A0A3S5B2N9_9PLAT|nr:unnamed protein product [Protopolystoma xenopodis]
MKKLSAWRPHASEASLLLPTGGPKGSANPDGYTNNDNSVWAPTNLELEFFLASLFQLHQYLNLINFLQVVPKLYFIPSMLLQYPQNGNVYSPQRSKPMSIHLVKRTHLYLWTSKLRPKLKSGLNSRDRDKHFNRIEAVIEPVERASRPYSFWTLMIQGHHTRTTDASPNAPESETLVKWEQKWARVEDTTSRYKSKKQVGFN